MARCQSSRRSANCQFWFGQGRRCSAREIRVARPYSKIIIDVSADNLWQVIGDFGAADHYLTGVLNYTVEGEGVGALRTLTSFDGGTIVERLETADHAAHRLSYILLTGTPFTSSRTW